MVNGLAIFIHITLPMNFWNIMIKCEKSAFYAHHHHQIHFEW
ncbi:hypothetical protein DERF_008674 [Dermatophagoides farinae]|uniref:Uncharacterized protein n=1 Tax=Dermatophagoides farinae TaxID=6954 RepID=A0A922I4Y9_DERFA|nr:hypothetical protein DERF_008674 [Dermatophagoides farinae]